MTKIIIITVLFFVLGLGIQCYGLYTNYQYYIGTLSIYDLIAGICYIISTFWFTIYTFIIKK
jgi:hypothetical protein